VSEECFSFFLFLNENSATKINFVNVALPVYVTGLQMKISGISITFSYVCDTRALPDNRLQH
jgi:hypothetical protein